jgi:hypothetical protein
VPPIADLHVLISRLQPTLNPGTFAFATLSSDQRVEVDDVVAFVREPEGISVVVDDDRARQLGLTTVFRCAWITLTVHSDLHAVGLTAAFASALASAGIGCNVVAGTNHDHIFVPVDRAQAAMDVLRQLQEGHRVD